MADLDGIGVAVHGRASWATGREPGTETGGQIWIEFPLLFVNDGSLTAVQEQGNGTGEQIWMEFQFLFMVEAPERPVRKQELELEGRFG